jgi:hypothetical protein
MRALAIALLLGLFAPGTAAAAKLERSADGTIHFTAGAGEGNYVSASHSSFPEGWSVESRAGVVGAPITPDLTDAPGCSPSGTNETVCTGAPALTRWVIDGLDGNDTLTTFGAASVVDGGDGNDYIRTGEQDDVLRGGQGDDSWLEGGAGNDTIDGGPGNDRMLPQDGGDDVHGGDGVDEVTYQYFYDDKPVSITLDDAANDGVPGAHANIHSDVEDMLGGEGNDYLEGDGDANRLRGGFETIRGNGNDILDGRGGRDAYEAGSENDTIRARDGIAEPVDCGDGTDTAVVDTIDTVTACETIDASAELEPDRDFDGYDAPADCDDHNSAIHPGASDAPENGVDEDCTDGDAQILDRDRDGYNRPADCNDNDAAVHPGAPEALDNGLDEDCLGGDAINYDRDGDGVGRPQDCDDADPARSPARPEVYGNAKDEDCSGRADPYQRLAAEVQTRWKPVKGGTKVVRLVVAGAPVGALVELRCQGGGCPPRQRVRVRRAGDVKLRRYLGGRRLRAGAVLEVRVTLRGTIGRVARFRFRKGKVPRRASLCLDPGATRPAAC